MNVYDQNFRGGRGGGWGGGSSEGCFKWVVGGHFKGISPKTSKNEVGKGKSCS